MDRRHAVAVLAVIAALLLGAAPARATVGSLTVNNSSPTNAAGARTQYVITFTTSAPTGQMTLTFPEGTSFSGYSGSAVFDGATSVGSCDSGNQTTRKINCFRAGGGVIQGGHAVKITLNGIVNPGTAGPLTVITNVDPDAASAAVSVVTPQAVGPVSVDFSSPTTARGGRTMYSVGFTTSSNGGLAYAANSLITLKFPAGTSFAGYSGSAVLDGTTDVGSCDSGDQQALTIRCFLDFGKAIAASRPVTVTLNGITNPAAASGILTVSTSSDTAADSGTLSFDPSHSIGPVTVTNSPPTNAAGARTLYTISFATSVTGGLAYAGNSVITLKLPDGVSFAGYSGSALLDGTADVGYCDSGDAATTTVHCYLDFGKSIAAGHTITITLNGVVNSSTPGPVTVSTTSDIQPLASADVTVSSAKAVSGVTVDNATPTRAAGGRTVYVVGFTTSTTGGLAYAANSVITLKFPGGTSFAGYSGTRVEDTTAGSADIGYCDSGDATLTVHCFLDFGQAIGPSHGVKITLNGITNPSTAGGVTVSTTSDTQPLTSAPVTLDGSNPLTQPTVDYAAPTDAAGGRTVYAIGFRTSATGGLAYTANSVITLTFPTGTSFAGYSGTRLEDTTAGTGDIGYCDSGDQASTVHCYLDFGQAIGPSHGVKITLNGIANPSSAGALTLSTTSDPQNVTSPTITPQPPLSVGALAVSPASVAASAITSYTIDFTTSARGALDYVANSVITLKFPPGTAYAGGSSSTVTVDGTDIGYCDSGTLATRTTLCYLDFGRRIGAGTPVRIVVGNIKNPTTESTGNQVTVSTSSDTSTAATPPYSIGPDTAAPDTTVSGGPSGTTSGTTATFLFGSSEAGSTFVCRLDGPGGAIGPEPCTSPKTYAGLGPGTYTFAVVATDPAGNPDPSPVVRSFSVQSATTPTPQPAVSPMPTPAATPTPAPEFHKDVLVLPVSGTVKVKLKGTNTFIDLASAKDIPLGSTIDVKAGKIQLSSVPKQGGKPQTATFYGGVFQITQPGGITDLKLNEALAACPKAAKQASAAAKKKKPKTRKLWGQGSGSFRTTGSYSAATVRGTKWLVQDSCAGTLTRVTQGVVNVRDNVRRKTVVVRAGHRYVAKPRR